jgi:signal transduction histidine kinase
VTSRVASLLVVSCLVVGAGLVMVLALGRSPTSDEYGLIAAALGSVVVATLAYEPLKHRLAARAARLSRNPRPDPHAVLELAAGRLSQPVAIDDLLSEVVQMLRSGLGLAAAEVWTCEHSRLELAASDPYREPHRIDLGPAEAQALMGAQLIGRAWLRVWLPTMLDGHAEHRVRAAVVRQPGVLVGLIVLELREEVEELSVDQEHTLLELARQVGLTLQNAQLDGALRASIDELSRQADELRRSRSRVVAAGDAERRRIERDLHDGAQQHLVAISVNLKLARDLANSEPERAAELLGLLGRDIELAMVELRDLAHGVYPSLLQQHGLDGALRAAAQRTGLDVSVAASTTDRYPEQVETAVYFCCVEALQNAAKHAGSGTSVSVSVEQHRGELSFAVEDDGAGFDPAASNGGAGLVGIGDRVAALGGSVEVESAVGRGTSVRGVIPLAGKPTGQAG